MKKYCFVILTVLLPFLSFSNVNPIPQKVYPITIQDLDMSFYENQIKAWQSVIDADVNNPEAWQNLYTACRVVNIKSREKTHDLDAIIEKMKVAIPNTFEYHFLLNYNDNSPENFHHLEKAYQLKPDRFETYDGFFKKAIMEGNKAKSKEFAQKWMDSGMMSPGILSWNYNVLMSVDDNAILITVGDNDTYPVWLLQADKDIRTDVTCLNIHLLAHYEDYRLRVFDNLGVASFDKNITDFSGTEEYYLAIVDHIKSNTKYPIYFTTMTYGYFRKAYKDELGLTGLTFKLADENFDNLPVLQQNYEDKFLTEYLTIDIYNDLSESVVNMMNMSYMPALTQLYNHYKCIDQMTKAASIKSLAYTISKRRSEKSYIDIKKYFEQPTIAQGFSSTKAIDKRFVKFKDQLWFSTTEESYADYQTFMTHLLNDKNYDAITMCKILKVDWTEFLPEKAKGLTENNIYVHGKPEDDNMPIYGISYEAATMYCQWLTDEYNNSTYKKKKYKKVKFRLPSKEEWTLAARGGADLAPYPWGGYYHVNAEGCYLSNFNVTDEKPCEDCKTNYSSNDGGFFTVPIDAYFPNNFGAYNMSGNVAEMTQTKGIAMGGSWNDKPENCKVDSEQQYTEATPYIGFRVFMEVLEYQ